MSEQDRDFAQALCERNLANAIRDTAREFRRLVDQLDEFERRTGQLDPDQPEAYKLAADVQRAITTAMASAVAHRVVAAAGEFDATMADHGVRS